MLEKIKYRLRNIAGKPMLRIPMIMLLCAVTAVSGVFLHQSLRTVRIFDGESRYLVRSLSDDVSTALCAVRLKSDRYRIKALNRKSYNTDVEIEYTFPVYLTIGGTTRELEAARGTVAQILSAAGIAVDQYDFLEPSADTLITETAYIDFTDVNYVSGSYTEAVPAAVETIYSSELPAGSVSEEKGTDGVRQVNYTSRTVNGETVETRIDGTVLLSEAISAKKIIGTKPAAAKTVTASSVSAISTLAPAVPIELDENGIPIGYTKHTTVQATAYTYTGHNCATGVAPQPGYIAVNPKIIPYGTRMYIVSSDGRFTYGYAVAADTGGFAKSRPTNVDLFFSTRSDCAAFGRRNVEIYFLP